MKINVKISETRNYGIDLLRITAMIMVVILHVIMQGGAIAGVDIHSGQYKAGWFLEVAAYCAVNCYALISGYVGIRAKYKYSNLIMLWLRVIFYSLGITVLCRIFAPDLVGAQQWLMGFFPVMSNHYWYFTAYFCMFFVIPLLNAGINYMSREQAKALVIALVAVLCVLQSVFPVLFPDLFPVNVFGTLGGYDVMWLIALYIIGAYIGKYRVFENITVRQALFGYVFLCLFTWLAKLALRYCAAEFWSTRDAASRLVNNLSPTILGAAVCLLVAFEKMKLPDTVKKLTAVISPLAFSVYLIHTQKLVWEHVLASLFKPYGGLPVPLYVAAILATALGIFCICVLIDMGREWLFQKAKNLAASLYSNWLS